MVSNKLIDEQTKANTKNALAQAELARAQAELLRAHAESVRNELKKKKR